MSNSGQQFTTLCLRQGDGRFVAQILERPRIRAIAGTRTAAEEQVVKECAQRLEDEDDARVAREREKEGNYISLAELKRRHGYSQRRDFAWIANIVRPLLNQQFA